MNAVKNTEFPAKSTILSPRLVKKQPEKQGKDAGVVSQKETPTPVVAQIQPEIAVKNPFADWERFVPHAVKKQKLGIYALFTGNNLTFSTRATDDFGLRNVKTVDLLRNGSKIGVVLDGASSGRRRVTQDPRSSGGVKISAQGIATAWGLDLPSMRKRRLFVEEVAPGYLVIDMDREVAGGK